MEKFEIVTGIAAPMPAANVDTDIIMPKAFLMRIDKEGVLEGLFHDLRVDENGNKRPEFVLNQKPYRQAKFLVVGPNFGCGSSREHAVWGLQKRGIRALIGSSFNGIFFDNCANNGILAITLQPAEISEIICQLQSSENKEIAVDLNAQNIKTPNGKEISFEIDPLRKEKLLKGLDTVGQTLQMKEKICDFEKNYFETYPWLAPKKK